MEPSCPLGTTRFIPQAKFSLKPYNKFFIDQVCSVKMAGYWPRFKDLDFVSVHKHAKKELGQYSAILTSHLVNNPYIINLLTFEYSLKEKIAIEMHVTCLYSDISFQKHITRYSATCSPTGSSPLQLYLYLLLTEFEGCTFSYGPSFFLLDLWPKREARGP